MRFCNFVPLDTFSIIQSLRKTSSTSITHQSTALAWKTTFSHVEKPPCLYLERSPHR